MHLFMKLKSSSVFITTHFLTLLAAFSVCALPCRVAAATFSARISPPNFELKTKPGEVVRGAITISNEDEEPAHYQIRTADWTLNEKGGVVITPADQPLSDCSCRPWTRIERRSLKLGPKAVKPFRFEVHVPENAPDGQCRFAVLIRPAQETMDPLAFANFKFPIAGAIAVIVYVTVGDAKADLEFQGMSRNPRQGKQGPVLRFLNNGNAHARPFGSFRIKDAHGKKAELVVVPFPILPGAVYDVELMVDPEISGITSMQELTYPLELEGMVEWDGGRLRTTGKVP